MTVAYDDGTELDDVERMHQRIDDLLKHAEHCRRTGEDAQADAALARAQAIMVKHSIDAAVIAARRAAGGARATEEVVVKTMNITGIYRTALAINMHALLQATGVPVRSFTSTSPKLEQLSVVGFESDARQLVTLATSIQLQAISSLNRWWQVHPERSQLRGMTGYKERRQYVGSFVRGATDRIEEARRVALGGEPGTELVLRTRREPIDEFVTANFRLSTRRTNMQPGRSVAADAGRKAGRRANTGDTAVGNDRRQLTSGG